jgi:hypothetical protein
MCKLTESSKSGDAEVDVEQEPELRPIWVVAKVYYGTNNREIYGLYISGLIRISSNV